MQYLWLPLSHSFGKVLLAAQVATGSAAAVDGRVDRIIDNLAVVSPTFMAAAPRIFEKVRGRVVTMAEDEGGPRLKIFTWAMGVGREVSRLQRAGQQPGAVLRAKHGVADKLVFSKLRARFGGKLRFLVSGSAALSPDVAEFFHAAGILILEGYGLTETSAGTFVNRPANYRLGTVGLPVPRAPRSASPTTARCCCAARASCRATTGCPSRPPRRWTPTAGCTPATSASSTTRASCASPTARRTSSRPRAASTSHRRRSRCCSRASCALASQIVVHGDGRNYITALVTLDADALNAWAAHRGVTADYAELTRNPDVHAEVSAAIDGVNAQLNRWETVKTFRILDRDLTIEDGEITPSMKVKRKVVEQRYADVIAEMYPDS